MIMITFFSTELHFFIYYLGSQKSSFLKVPALPNWQDHPEDKCGSFTKLQMINPRKFLGGTDTYPKVFGAQRTKITGS